MSKIMIILEYDIIGSQMKLIETIPIFESNQGYCWHIGTQWIQTFENDDVLKDAGSEIVGEEYKYSLEKFVTSLSGYMW